MSILIISLPAIYDFGVSWWVGHNSAGIDVLHGAIFLFCKDDGFEAEAYRLVQAVEKWSEQFGMRMQVEIVNAI